tara:strand:- start:2803 stop:3159 length:357 start_codon:yes stop_codon:yes gene_type:complete
MGNRTKYENRIIHKTLSVSMREDDLIAVNNQLHEIVHYKNAEWRKKAKQLEGQAQIDGIEVQIRPQKNYISKQHIIKDLIQKEWDATVGIERGIKNDLEAYEMVKKANGGIHPADEVD